MVTMPSVEINAPDVAPRRFGLLSVADINTVSVLRSLAGTDYRSNGCVPTLGVAGDLCGTQTAKPVHEDNEWSEGFTFSAFMHRECRAIADFNDAKDRATALYNAGEQNAIETALWGFLVAHPEVVVLHGGTALSVKDGIAALEGYAGRVYAGDPIIHAPRGVISLAGQEQVERHGNRLETVLGAWVAGGGGYGHNGPGTAAADGVSWMFATGKVFGEQGTLSVNGPHMVQSPRDNSARVIAERSYSLNVDCFVAAVLVTNDGINLADGS